MTPNPADILGTMTDAAAGAALGVSKTTATRMRRAAGIPPCGRRADGDATRARVLAALDGEWRTTREVAERAGVSVSTARVVLWGARGSVPWVRVDAQRRALLWRRA